MASIVDTAQGKLRGSEDDGVLVFRGVPYAASPTGDGRWRAPRPVPAWDGTRPAEEFGSICPQNPSPLERLFGSRRFPQDEDCLTLNVWTPDAGDARLPVMVWIHGGAFRTGSGRTPWYDGRRFARSGVVLVTINYRLGPLGFIDLRELFGDEVDANPGIRDQIAALRWVRENIAAFGGDPDDVTVFGESAGGGSVGTLLAAPEAKGLFAKAIPQSGAGHWALPPEVATRIARSIVEGAGIEPGDAEALRAVPVERLLEASESLPEPGTPEANELYGEDFDGAGMAYQPVIDGDVVPRRPIDAIADGSASDVRVLVGTNAEEWRLFTAFLPEGGGERARAPRPLRNLLAKAGRSPDDFVAAYRDGGGSEVEVRTALETDRMFRIPAIRLAEAQARNGAGAHLYEFAWPTPAFGGKLGACHALEIPFVFDNLDAPGADAFTGEDAPQELADACHGAWVSFATSGDPSHPGVGEWPAYDLERRPTMMLDVPSQVEDDPKGAERVLWDGVL